MKNLFFLLFIIVSSSLYGQTDSIEKATITAKFLSKDLTQEALSQIGSKWNILMKKINKYPDLPLDQNGVVHYQYLNDFKNMKKEILFNRILEFLTINYGFYPSNLYSNSADGKIIFNGSFNIDGTYSGIYTAVISIKDEKLRIEFINIGFQAFYGAHDTGGTWYPDRTTNSSISQFYPVLLKESSQWVVTFNLFKSSNEYYKNEVDKLSNFLTTYDSTYAF